VQLPLNNQNVREVNGVINRHWRGRDSLYGNEHRDSKTGQRNTSDHVNVGCCSHENSCSSSKHIHGTLYQLLRLFTVSDEK
jgi:hypothetical protein